MNILLITGIFPPDIGGPATYVPCISASLADRGHRITVITLSTHTIHDDVGYPFKVFRIARGMWKPLRWLRTVVMILWQGLSADLFYVNGLAMEVAIANLILRKPIAQKVVGDFAWERARQKGWTHDDFHTFQINRQSWKVNLLKVLRNWWIRNSDIVIVPSRYLSRWVETLGVQGQRIRVIYNAIELAGDFYQVQAPLDTEYKVVTVCRLVPWKGIKEVMDAITSLKEVGLVVIGDGPERMTLEHHAERLEIGRRVFFAGALSHIDTLALMKACNVFVLNSQYEGLPHIVLEAMGLGLPVIATSVGGTPEVVRDGVNGVLVPAKNVSALRESIIRILTDESIRVELVAQGHKTVAKKFNIQAMVDQTENVLSELVVSEGVPIKK